MISVEAVFYREGKIRFTNFIWMFWDLFYPLGYMLLFGVGMNYALGSPFHIAGISYNAFFLAGVLGMASFGIASNTAWGFFVDRDNGIFYETLTYPMSRSAYLLGKVLFNLLLAAVQAAVTVWLAWLILDVPIRGFRLPLLFAGIVVGTAGWFFFYAIFALRMRRNDLFNTVNSILYFVFLFASSMFYPLASLPSWFRTVALVNPITWQVDLFRYSTIGLGAAGTILWESGAFVLFSLVSFVLAVRALQRQE